MSRTALVILDLQNCFITDKTKSLPQKIKEHIETQKYDFIIFSKFINSESSNFVKKLNWNKCKTSPEINIVSELSELALKNHIFEKNAYSIFKSKQFVDFLSQHKISKLFFCGSFKTSVYKNLIALSAKLTVCGDCFRLCLSSKKSSIAFCLFLIPAFLEKLMYSLM